MCLMPGVFSRIRSMASTKNLPTTNLFPRYPNNAVTRMVEMKTSPGISLATDGIMLSIEEMTYQITKIVSPIGPMINSP